MHMRIASDHVIEKPCCRICQIELQERITEKKTIANCLKHNMNNECIMSTMTYGREAPKTA